MGTARFAVCIPADPESVRIRLTLSCSMRAAAHPLRPRFARPLPPPRNPWRGRLGAAAPCPTTRTASRFLMHRLQLGSTPCHTHSPTRTMPDPTYNPGRPPHQLQFGSTPCVVHKKFSILFVQTVLYCDQRVPDRAVPGKSEKEIRECLRGQRGHLPDDTGSKGMGLAAWNFCALFAQTHHSERSLRINWLKN